MQVNTSVEIIGGIWQQPSPVSSIPQPLYGVLFATRFPEEEQLLDTLSLAREVEHA
jgi:hypothetical protein